MKRPREPEDPLSLSAPSSPVQIVTVGGRRTSVDTSGTAADAVAAAAAAAATMICQLHRERLVFASYDAYESHYRREHLNRCVECRKNFPSPLYLGLHADECHDPFVAVRRDKGEHTFGCFVEGCARKCASADKRRRHLLDKHGFPRNFYFGITQFGIDGRHSLLDDGGRRHQRRASLAQSAAHPQPETHAAAATAGEATTMDDAAAAAAAAQDTAPDVDMDDLAGAMSAMTFVPRSVRFGRGGKVGFARRARPPGGGREQTTTGTSTE